jgi:glycosyltransferase involved in cell wall biosynthesis
MKICIIGAHPSSLINFRGELISLWVSNGHQVIALASGATEDEKKQMHLLGVKYIDYPVQRNGLNPISDAKTLLTLFSIFKREQPDIIFAYTIKPVIWGGVAAKFSSAKFYALITGLGFAFHGGGVKRKSLRFIVKSLYKLALRRARKVIFQNEDDMKTFIDYKIIEPSKATRVNGSGVNTVKFNRSFPCCERFTFLMIARLLKEKGVREYLQAARKIKSKFPDVKFVLVGPQDPSPDGIDIKEILEWDRLGIIEYKGSTDNVIPFLRDCNVFVLPSYHEGMPRSVLEAMSVGRPILTTNVPGCKETVLEGINGFLVEKQNVEQLVDRMLWFIENQECCHSMSEQSRKIALEKFDVKKVNQKILNEMELI